MPTRISFDFYGEAQVDRRLERVELAAQDASPAFDRMGDSFARAMKRQFSSEGAYGSGGWVPLSPAYARWKHRAYPGKKILQRTGDLYDSLTRRPFDIDVVERHMAIFGSDVDYGVFHQTGAGHVPQRKVVDLPESLRRSWVKMLQRFLITGYHFNGPGDEV